MDVRMRVYYHNPKDDSTDKDVWEQSKKENISTYDRVRDGILWNICCMKDS